MMKAQTNIHIVGSGVAGIAASIRLALKGHKVTVFERHDKVGGKLDEFQEKGYRFDMGPSLLTKPYLIDELFELAGRKSTFKYQQLPIVCKYFFDDATKLNAYAESEKFANEVEEKLGVPADVISDYLKYSQNIDQNVGDIFLTKSLHKLETFLDPKVLKALVRTPQFDVFTSMHEANERRLKHPKLVQLFDRYATYNGSNPYKAPGILNIIPSLEFTEGAFFPLHGMRDIVNQLHELATSLGVEFKLNEGVDEILLSNNKVISVKTDKDEYTTDAVFSNMDVYPTYRKLLPKAKAPEKALAQERSSSGLIFYWGMKGLKSELDVHNIFFSIDYKDEFDHLFEYKKVTDDPTVYVHISSKEVASDAPVNSENWFVMINVPANNGTQDWDEVIQRSRKNIIQKLEKSLGYNIADHIEVERILDPRSIEQNTASWQGALYGSSSNDRMAAFLRHPNFSSKIKGLYFCGGSVHPGGGIPLCLLSAKVSTDIALKEYL
ncbi:1-hydroxycarotenoid 3,4-desaturase CrtD [Sediminitomix flava]|uniref:Phytoene desaturase n=1 Tax=Sediminitomix flava TaxID=379075 RepID=A0A315ZAM0_SEDFL|nr:1-hydroxycarotenoid 3,4-desaturase CrtD [Sediminitomix flava]PWJ41878.1 phytoene desaturase [Sediminitomix flava]